MTREAQGPASGYGGGISCPRRACTRWIATACLVVAIALGVTGLLSACGGCSRSAERTGGVTRRTVPQPGAGVSAPGNSPASPADSNESPGVLDNHSGGGAGAWSWMVAGIAPSSRSDEVIVHPIRVQPDGARLARAFSVARRTVDGRKPMPQALSCRGDTLWAARGDVVERRQPFVRGSRVQSAKLDIEPRALLGLGNHVVVGGPGRVSWVDFSRTSPAPDLLYEHATLRKPVDFFVEMGLERVVAVDDVVRPKVGFFFDRLRDNTLHFQFEAALPSGPNETYASVAADGRRLALVSRFGVRTGHGNRLYTCALAGQSVDCDTVTEMVPVRRDQAPVLLAGSAGTPWRGVALGPGVVFVGAGERGILAIHGKKAVRVGPKATCLDLVGTNGRVLALMAFGASSEGDTGLRAPGGRRAVVRKLLVLARWDSSAQHLVEQWRSPVPREVELLVR